MHRRVDILQRGEPELLLESEPRKESSSYIEEFEPLSGDGMVEIRMRR